MKTGMKERIITTFKVISVFDRYPKSIEVRKYYDQPDSVSIGSDLWMDCILCGDSVGYARNRLESMIKRGLEDKIKWLKTELELAQREKELFDESGIDAFAKTEVIDYSNGI